VKGEVLNFFKKTNTAKKILVLDLGFLGDTVHLIPALWMIKGSYIDATIDVAVSANVTSLLDCFPWINKAWGYSRYPKHATLAESFSFVKSLRKEKYDVVINLNGSDRSGWLTVLCGAPKRLGRLTSRGERRVSKLFFTDYIQYPFDLEPIFVQRCRCLEKAGLSYIEPNFHCEVKPEFLEGTGVHLDDDQQYFHVSPFTTADRKELPLSVLIELINGMNEKWPSKKIVLSCAPIEREQKKMEELVSHLSFTPWRVYKGTLNLVQLTAVIKHSAFHLSGDTGPMHIAVMTQTPSISWFQPTKSMDWIPQGVNHKVLFGTDGYSFSNIQGVSANNVLNEVKLLVCFGLVASK
jgi:ADP-heptose:LPS heptosyltransferase